MNKILLFGASRLGEIAFSMMNDKSEIGYFIDNDKMKLGKTICEKKIISLNEAIALKEYYIVICSQYDLEIVKQLINIGIKKFGVFELNKTEEKYKVIKYNYSQISNFEIDNNKVILIVENNSGSNTLALYKNNYIKDRYDVKIVYVKNKYHNYYYDMLTSGTIVRSHDGTYNSEQLNIQMWHGFPLKGLSYMSNYYRQDKEKNHTQWNKINTITSYSQMYNALISACYGVDISKFNIVGMPRNDLLCKKGGKEILSNILNRNIRNNQIIMYTPTFRNSTYGEKNGESIYNSLDFKRLNVFLKKNDYILILKLHPVEENNIGDLEQYSNIYLLKENDLQNNKIDLYEVIGETDMLITDYSSLYFDYLLLDKPIVFYSPDIEIYEKERGFLLEPYDFWTPGPKVFNQSDLHKEIENSLNYPLNYSDDRQVVRKIVHKFEDNKSSERVWELIDEMIKERK